MAEPTEQNSFQDRFTLDSFNSRFGQMGSESEISEQHLALLNSIVQHPDFSKLLVQQVLPPTDVVPKTDELTNLDTRKFDDGPTLEQFFRDKTNQEKTDVPKLQNIERGMENKLKNFGNARYDMAVRPRNI